MAPVNGHLPFVLMKRPLIGLNADKSMMLSVSHCAGIGSKKARDYYARFTLPPVTFTSV